MNAARGNYHWGKKCVIDSCSSAVQDKDNFANYLLFNHINRGVTFGWLIIAREWCSNKFIFLCLKLNNSSFINPFQASISFLYPLKTSENHRFSDIFRGHRNGTLTWNGLILYAVSWAVSFWGKNCCIQVSCFLFSHTMK